MKTKKFHLVAACLFVTAIVSVAVMSHCGVWQSLLMSSGIGSIYSRAKEFPFVCYVFDVGRANSILLSCDGYNILVDCGYEKAQCNTLDYLSLADVSSIDLLVLTHPDKDHIGNMADLLDYIPVKRFVTCNNGQNDVSELYADLMSKLSDIGLDIEYANIGDTLSFGGLSLEMVAPCRVYDDSNNNSVAMRAVYNDFSIFLSGDIEKEAERDILLSGANLESDVLCVAHHGSASSTTLEFLEGVNPQTAVISVEENDYLPSNKTLKRLIDFGCNIYRTDESGVTAVLSDGKDYRIITQR